jgi:hypothetical protein
VELIYRLLSALNRTVAQPESFYGRGQRVAQARGSPFHREPWVLLPPYRGAPSVGWIMNIGTGAACPHFDGCDEGTQTLDSFLINSYVCRANSTNPRHLSEVYGVWVYSSGAVWFGGNSPAVAWGLRGFCRSFHAFHLLLLIVGLQGHVGAFRMEHRIG